MILRHRQSQLFSEYETLDGEYIFLCDGTGAFSPPAKIWMVYRKGEEEPMYFGAALQRGFPTLWEATQALARYLKDSVKLV